MYSGQRFQAFPGEPVSLQSSSSSNMQTNTCTKGHMVPRKYCILIGEHTHKHIHYTKHEYGCDELSVADLAADLLH